MSEELASPAPIRLRDKGDIVDMMAGAGGPRRQGLRGFDPDYVDIVDYIVRLTHRVWEEKAVGLIYDTYAHNVAVWTTDGLTKGRETVVANTLRSLAEYTTSTIYVDEVVWAGNDEDGFHTSMLATSIRYNTGYSAFGPPTGRRVVGRGIANCFVKGNRIVEEWLAHDGLSVIRQLGFDPREAAIVAARADAARGKPRGRHGEVERIIGQGVPPAYAPPAGAREAAGGFDVEDFVRRGVHEIWNRRMINKVDDYYAPEIVCHTSSAKELYGRGDVKVHILGLLGAFPDAMIAVDDLYWLDDGRGGYRTATRWTLIGSHGGPGIYGPPTGREVRLLGLTQHRIAGGKIVEEWTVYDEFALLKQLVPIE